MQSKEKDGSRPVEIDTHRTIYPVAFAENGEQVVSGGVEGALRRWRVDDGREVGEPIRIEAAEIYSIALSPDRKWIVCGLRLLAPTKGRPNASVWNAQTCEKVFDIKDHTDTVFAVDISPDSTKFTTGGAETPALLYIWSMTTGDRLVGPVEHDGWVMAVKFSPTGDRIAAATADYPDEKSIRIYDSENGHQLLDIPFRQSNCVSTSLAWSTDGRQLFAASYAQVKRFDTYSGSLLSTWSVPGEGRAASVVLSRNQTFAVVSAFKTVSFWDTSTQQQIGAPIKHENDVWSVALSPNDNCITTGEENGKVTIRNLSDHLPASYMAVNVSDQRGSVRKANSPLFLCAVTLPLLYISDTTFESWIQGDLTRAEQLMTVEVTRSSDPFQHARALGQRALVRARLKQWEMAIDDAKQSIKTKRSVAGYIAYAVAHVRNGEHESTMRIFDLVFSVCLPSENSFLLLIKAIILFQSGKHDDSIGRIDDLIDIVDDPSQYITVRAQMLLLLGNMSMKGGDNKRAIELFKRAQEAIPFQQAPQLKAISLIFGWDFDRLAAAIQIQLYKAMNAEGHGEAANSLSAVVETLSEEMVMGDASEGWDPDIVQRCLMTCENDGDAAVKANDLSRAVIQYSTALALNPSDPVGLLVKRSNVRAMSGLWEEALKDADDATKVNPSSPWGYERRHSALHALRRYDEAITAFARMHSLIEVSLDQDVRQRGKKYVSPARSEMAINNFINDILKISPLILIDVGNGRLCDGPERMNIFKSETEFKQLLSLMTEVTDEDHIQAVVGKYFEYVTLSHVWQGKEPSFQDVSLAGSVWELESSPLNDKLRKFCEVVRAEGYRWAWSDTCCIDKTISTVLNQSLTMMYKWYSSSAATFIHLASVASPSVLGDLSDSTWMTRAWTAQELLASRVIRFYTRDWKLYLDDTRSNHKDSPEIMQELAGAIGIARETIVDFKPDDLSVREKLRVASKRKATVEEDVAYSLIGIFKSDIIPRYGEGDAALGHLLEEIVTRSGEVTVLAWTGKSSSYNSSLPASLAVYNRPPGTSPAIDEAEMAVRVSALRNSLPQTDIMLVYDRLSRLPPARFANRRLYLPCIIFAVKRLALQGPGDSEENRYRARVPGLSQVDFQTSDKISPTEPRRLVFVHPWIRDLRDPLDSFAWASTADDGDHDTDPESDSSSSPISPSKSYVVPVARMDDYTRALRLTVRLQMPFHVLLLQQQPNGELRRVAAEHEIVVPRLEDHVNLARDIRTEVVEIL